MNLPAVRALTILATINGTPHHLDSMAMQYTDRWYVTMVEAGRVYVATRGAGFPFTWSVDDVEFVVDSLLPDRVFVGSFDG